MGLSLRGQTSGAVDINAPAVAGDNTITLPGGNGSANQFYKNSDTAGIITHSSMTESSSGVISIGDIDINGTTRTITTGVGQTVGFGTDIKIQGSVRIEDPSVSATRLSITYEGIDFQNTGAGSSSTATAHLLDDYEEGTFTPMYWAATGGIITQSTLQTGQYNKLGDVCWINIRIATTEATAFTGYSGQLRIENLPFASAIGDRVGALAIGEMWRWETTADAEFTRARVNSGGETSINLVNNNESAGSEAVFDVVDLDLGTNRNILNLSGWYRVA